jgi:hypothetical protein
MVVVYFPLFECIIFALIISTLIIYFYSKKQKLKYKLFMFMSTFFILTYLLLRFYYFIFPIPLPKIMCQQFEFYTENRTCKLGGILINYTADCEKLQERLSLPRAKECPPGTIPLS